MHSLPVFLRLAGRPVILLGDGPAAAAKRRLLERAGARIAGEEDDAALAIVALDAPEEAAARLRARGLLLNVVDRPDLCDFTLPAIVDRDPVLVAIGTGGASAGLAAALRQRLEAMLPPDLGAIAATLADLRGWLRDHFPEATDRRRVVGGLLAAGGALDPFASIPDTFSIADIGAPPARLERVAITSADPDELTLRAARLLGQADRVHHPADMAVAILDRARADAERIAAPAPAEPGAGLTVELIWA